MTYSRTGPGLDPGVDLGTAPKRTAWVGWIVFAAIMLIVIGAFGVIEGLVGIFKDGYYLVPKSGLVVTVDYTAWGWVHLVLGLIALATGFGILAGKMWARILGVGYAVVNAIVNLAFLAAYPIWCTIMITFDVLVIWALTAHGKEMKEPV